MRGAPPIRAPTYGSKSFHFDIQLMQKVATPDLSYGVGDPVYTETDTPPEFPYLGTEITGNLQNTSSNFST